MQSHRFLTERAKISFIISLLRGKALQCAETTWQQSGLVTQSLDSSVAHFHKVFARPLGDSSISDQLYHLHHGKMSFSEYALKFKNTLAGVSGMSALSLELFVKGCQCNSSCILLHRMIPSAFEIFTNLTIPVSHHMQGCQDNSQGQLQSLTSKLNLPTLQNQSQCKLNPLDSQWLTRGLCLYCGDSGCAITTCPIIPLVFW